MDFGLYLDQDHFQKLQNPEKLPRDIFISAYNTSPFTPNLSIILKDNEEDFQTGLDILSKLTSGNVHLSVSADETNTILLNAKNVQLHKLLGPHPANGRSNSSYITNKKQV